MVPRSRNGSNRMSNLTIACYDCNTAKGSQPLTPYCIATG
ncbi:HNH endonuclease [Vreelandella rituensis]|nr:HNH endonuclease [Halomonas rituensis]